MMSQGLFFSSKGADMRFLHVMMLVTGSVLFVGANPARASAELRVAMREFAAHVKKLLDGEKETSIVAKFTGPTTFPATGDPGIVQILSEELRDVGISLKDRAKFGISGKYKLTEVLADNDDDKRLGIKFLAIELDATVVDQFENPVANLPFKRTIRGEATILPLLGLPVGLPPNGTPRDRDKEIRGGLAKPQTHVQNTIIRSKAESLYGIEIIVNKKPRGAENKEGLAYVPIQRGETYAVRIINDSPLEAAVQLRIDGISMFAFSELRQPDKLEDGKKNPLKGEPLYRVFLIPAKSRTEIIHGWHVNNKKTNEFLVTEYAKSAAAVLNTQAKIGTITATFQAAWPEGKDAPKDERGGTRSPGSGDATGFGSGIDVPLEQVYRNLGVIRDSVSVRYVRDPKDLP
jgi:hypothetical protein